jgi:hypothetical protein
VDIFLKLEVNNAEFVALLLVQVLRIEVERIEELMKNLSQDTGKIF